MVRLQPSQVTVSMGTHGSVRVAAAALTAGRQALHRLRLLDAEELWDFRHTGAIAPELSARVQLSVRRRVAELRARGQLPAKSSLGKQRPCEMGRATRRPTVEARAGAGALIALAGKSTVSKAGPVSKTGGRSNAGKTLKAGKSNPKARGRSKAAKRSEANSAVAKAAPADKCGRPAADPPMNTRQVTQRRAPSRASMGWYTCSDDDSSDESGDDGADSDRSECTDGGDSVGTDSECDAEDNVVGGARGQDAGVASRLCMPRSQRGCCYAGGSSVPAAIKVMPAPKSTPPAPEVKWPAAEFHAPNAAAQAAVPVDVFGEACATVQRLRLLRHVQRAMEDAQDIEQQIALLRAEHARVLGTLSGPGCPYVPVPLSPVAAVGGVARAVVKRPAPAALFVDLTEAADSPRTAAGTDDETEVDEPDPASLKRQSRFAARPDTREHGGGHGVSKRLRVCE
jgi:hypothetical protein